MQDWYLRWLDKGAGFFRPHRFDFGYRLGGLQVPFRRAASDKFHSPGRFLLAGRIS